MSSGDSFLSVAMRPDVVRRSAKVGAIVGTILVSINQGDAILGLREADDLLWKIPMTYMVPYLVSSYASVSAILGAEQAGN